MSFSADPNYSETWGYSYSEFDECIKTAENRTIVLPKTERGKPKKLNYTAVSTFRGIGVYLRFADGYIIIGNVTTQKTFHSENVKGKDYKAFNDWFDAWKKDTNEEDLKELEEFRTEKRQRQKYKEGDYFCFKYNRRSYGFGKIIIDVAKRRKDPKFKEEKNYGLNHLMGPALVVKIYHKLSPTKDIDINPDYAIGTFWFRFMGKSHSPMNHFRRFLVSAIFSLSVSPALSKYAPMVKVR